MKVIITVAGEPEEVLKDLENHLVQRGVKFTKKEVGDGHWLIGMMDALVEVDYGERDNETFMEYFSSTLFVLNEYVLQGIQRQIIHVRYYDTEVEADTYCDCGCGCR